MKHDFRFSLLLAAVCIMIGWATAGGKEDKMIAAAKALDQKFIEAYNKGDVDAVMATYWNSPELVSYPPDAMEVKGWQAAKDAFAHSFAHMKGAALELIESNYKVVGDAVITWGKWRLKMPAADGQTMEIEGRYTDVKAERDGKWVYIMDHASVPLLPPPAE